MHNISKLFLVRGHLNSGEGQVRKYISACFVRVVICVIIRCIFCNEQFLIRDRSLFMNRVGLKRKLLGLLKNPNCIWWEARYPSSYC